MNANERESMINDLYYIRDRITNIISITETQKKVASSFQSEEKYVPTPEKIPALAIICIAFLLPRTVMGLLLKEVAGLIICTLVAFLYYQNWATCHKSKNVFLTLLCLLVALTVYTLRFMIYEPNILRIVFLLVLAALTAVCWPVVRKVCEKIYEQRIKQVKSRNEAIAKKNEAIVQKNKKLQAQSGSLKQQLTEEVQNLQNYGDGWYPPDYYTLYAVDRFIDYFRNQRVNTMQEAINTLKDDDFKQQYLANQETQIANQQTQIKNQRIMNAQLAFSNVLQIANLAAINQNTSAIYENASAVRNAGNNITDAIKNRRW